MRMCLNLAVAVLAGVASSSAAQPVELTNAQVTAVAAENGLERVFDARRTALASPGWIGYAVPIVSGEHFVCDWNESGRLAGPRAVKLEGGDTLHVLYRIEQAAITRIRSFSEGC